ncbi:TauD/TfdA family dioxygenase [Rhodobacteraceae bacterium NNCM2]|nr:TauD/TfdA family dioxygenase [Coraliihabitans acroporae]
MTHSISFRPLAGAGFGVLATVDVPGEGAIDAFADAGAEVVAQFNRAGGLMVVRGLGELTRDAARFADLSRLFGPEVENVRETLTAPRFFHPEVAEVMRLANTAPTEHLPPPRAPAAPDGGFEVRHPHQTNWHTDQSYRRPPPDVTLLLGVVTPPPDQGQTLYADCTAAFAALPKATQTRLRGLTGIHAAGWIGRRPEDLRAGVPPKPLLPHQRPQRHPLVRNHPVTGAPALYLCQGQQMDHLDGPVAELEPGPDGEGARLVEELLRHITRPEFVYVHRWQAGDLVIGDNRCLLHAATWYDSDRHPREMWRTTVMGNPGAEYAGEAKSWIPAEGHGMMEGMEGA